MHSLTVYYTSGLSLVKRKLLQWLIPERSKMKLKTSRDGLKVGGFKALVGVRNTVNPKIFSSKFSDILQKLLDQAMSFMASFNENIEP